MSIFRQVAVLFILKPSQAASLQWAATSESSFGLMLADGVHLEARVLRPSHARHTRPMHDSATSLLCYPAPERPATAYQAFSQEQRPLMSGTFTRGEKEKILSQQWKGLSKPEKASYKVSGIERRNRARSPYNAFCQAQRPLLPPDLRNSQREKALGQQWAALTRAEKAKYAPVLVASVPALVTTAPVRAQALPGSWSTGWSWQPLEHRSAPPLEADRSRGKRAKTAARDSPSAALTTAPPTPLATLAPLAPLAPAPPMAVAVATAVEGWEAATTAAAMAAAGWATPFALSPPSTASTSPTASTSTSCTDTNNGWEDVLEEVLGLDWSGDWLFNSLEVRGCPSVVIVSYSS